MVNDDHTIVLIFYISCNDELFKALLIYIYYNMNMVIISFLIIILHNIVRFIFKDFVIRKFIFIYNF